MVLSVKYFGLPRYILTKLITKWYQTVGDNRYLSIETLMVLLGKLFFYLNREFLGYRYR